MLSPIKLIFALIISICLLSCEEATDWDLEPGENGKLVVDAILTNETIIQEVRLSLSYDDLNGTPQSVNNAIVTVEVNGLIFPFAAD